MKRARSGEQKRAYRRRKKGIPDIGDGALTVSVAILAYRI
jgi:hypothetical protein